MDGHAESELESLRRQLAETEGRARQQIESLREQLRTEVASLEQLQEIGIWLAEQGEVNQLLGELLDAAIAITAANMGNVQLLNAGGELQMAVQRGFAPPFLDILKTVQGADTSCGLALKERRRVIVEDVANSRIFVDESIRRTLLEAGVRAVQSTPLINRSGTVIGIFSTHYLQPCRPNDRDLQLLDFLGRQAVALIEKAQAEHALRQSERRFRDLADHAPVMIWVAGLDKKCTWFNRPWLEYGGRTMEQEIGDGWAEGVHPEDLGACLATYTTHFDRREPFRMEYRLRRHDGSWGWLLDQGAPMFDTAGNFLGYTGSCIDITDLKRAQEDALARQKLETLGVLTGGIAHNFNNLLGSILAEAELSEATLASGSSPAEGIAQIKAVALRASEIVRELMIYAGHDKGKPEFLDLSQLIQGMLELLRVSVSKRAVLITELPNGLGAVRADAAQLRQVVMNLVVNASEALGGKEGVITVKVAPLTEGGDGSPARALQIVVSDSGAGIAPESQTKIFDPFFSTKFAGRGLGLAVVKSIVDAHHGSIGFVSSPQTGTTFEVRLPCESEAIPNGRPSIGRVYTRTVAERQRSILVVDDETELRVAVGRLLRRRGFAVTEAGDGTAAWENLRNADCHFDAMILDLTLPGMPSREVFEQAQQLRPGLQVVFTSAHGKDAVDATVGIPVEHYVRKPFRIGGLIELLEEILP